MKTPLRCQASIALILLASTIGCTARAKLPAGPGRPTLFVSNVMHGTVSVVDPNTRQPMTDISVPRVGPRLPFPAFLAALPDGSKLYVASLNTESVVVIDTHTNAVTGRIPLRQVPQSMAATPDGRRLFIANDGQDAVVVDTATDEVQDHVPLGAGSVGVAISPDGGTVWFSTVNGISIVDAESNEVVATIPNLGMASQLAFAPDGKAVFVLGNYHPFGSVAIVDASTHDVVATITVESSPIAAAATPDGRWLYVVNRGSNTVSVIDLKTREVAHRLSVGNVPTGIAVMQDGSAVFVTDSMSNSLSVIAPASQKVVATVALNPPAQARPTGIAIVAVH